MENTAKSLKVGNVVLLDGARAKVIAPPFTDDGRRLVRVSVAGTNRVVEANRLTEVPLNIEGLTRMLKGLSQTLENPVY